MGEASNPRIAAALQSNFSARLIDWQAKHGRHGLPWQGTRDAYRVWLSEIMLQQTQVATVLAYYPRFLARFPSVAALAAAPEDEVMQLWAGLGYYSRARHLHRAAQQIMQDFGGVFPNNAAQLCQLPGVGMSTAAAIAAFCFGQRAAIFDANVQRVLARYLGFAEDLAASAAKKKLWAMACELLPTQNLTHTMPRYTQALMDLGASLCSARQAQCTRCPLATDCVACATGQPTALPLVNKKLQRKQLDVYLHWQEKGDAMYLHKRPARGVWGGLYCWPEISAAAYATLSAQPGVHLLPPIAHTLTHRDLRLHIVRQTIDGEPLIACAETGAWFTPAARADLGLPKPIAALVQAQAHRR